MSVRAYKVKKIDYEPNELFNLWHDRELMELLGDYLYPRLDDDGCGVADIEENELKEVYKKLTEWRGLKEKPEEKKEIDRQINIVKRLLNEAEADGFITVYCF